MNARATGPAEHPLRDVTVTWRKDGTVVITFKQPIEIRAAYLRARNSSVRVGRAQPGAEVLR